MSHTAILARAESFQLCAAAIDAIIHRARLALYFSNDLRCRRCIKFALAGSLVLWGFNDCNLAWARHQIIYVCYDLLEFLLVFFVEDAF